MSVFLMFNVASSFAHIVLDFMHFVLKIQKCTVLLHSGAARPIRQSQGWPPGPPSLHPPLLLRLRVWESWNN